MSTGRQSTIRGRAEALLSLRIHEPALMGVEAIGCQMEGDGAAANMQLASSMAMGVARDGVRTLVGAVCAYNGFALTGEAVRSVPVLDVAHSPVRFTACGREY